MKLSIISIIFPLALATFFLVTFNSAEAACRCVCVGNKMVSVCANSWDVPKYCSGVYCTGHRDNPQPPKVIAGFYKNLTPLNVTKQSIKLCGSAEYIKG
jgi:hypothetical protein